MGLDDAMGDDSAAAMLMGMSKAVSSVKSLADLLMIRPQGRTIPPLLRGGPNEADRLHLDAGHPCVDRISKLPIRTPRAMEGAKQILVLLSAVRDMGQAFPPQSVVD
eukprot:Selendium_serpulae@DN10471_c0_g1_i1.p2